MHVCVCYKPNMITSVRRSWEHLKKNISISVDTNDYRHAYDRSKFLDATQRFAEFVTTSLEENVLHAKPLPFGYVASICAGMPLSLVDAL